MPIIITDSTVLIGLDRIDQLNILPTVFSDEVAPPAVVEEFGKSPDWLTVRNVTNATLVASFRDRLDLGEAEAIVLATETPGSSLLMDEKRGRLIARQLGLDTIGTLGLLLLAKKLHHIPAVKPIVDELVSAGFHVSESLYKEVLELAEEK